MAMNVKFLRGVIANYNSLAEKNADTLYFCTDGALYLGANKIANWTDLTDVNAAIKALQDAGYQNAEQVGAAITEALKPYAKTADVNDALALKANQTDLETLEDRVDAFLTGTGATDALDSLQELIE